MANVAAISRRRQTHDTNMSVYAAFIEGAGPLVVSAKGGAVTSPGMVAMAGQARADGIAADTFEFDEYQGCLEVLRRMKALGKKVAIVSYSAGVGTATLISYFAKLDFLAAIDPSQDCINYRVNKDNVKKSVLWHNNNWLSKITGIGGAGENPDLGFSERIEIDVNHLVADLLPSIKQRVRQELLGLNQ